MRTETTEEEKYRIVLDCYNATKINEGVADGVRERERELSKG